MSLSYIAGKLSTTPSKQGENHRRAKEVTRTYEVRCCGRQRVGTAHTTSGREGRERREDTAMVCRQVLGQLVAAGEDTSAHLSEGKTF